MKVCKGDSETMGKEVVVTLEGLKKLEEELDYLKSVKRREISERIKEALGFGDISENSEFDEAKNEQASVEAKILTLEEVLRNAKVIDEDDVRTDAVSVGTRVRVFDVEFKEEIEYTIVGSTESNPLENKISNESPIGSALMGQKVGTKIKVDVPAGQIELKILEINK